MYRLFSFLLVYLFVSKKCFILIQCCLSEIIYIYLNGSDMEFKKVLKTLLSKGKISWYILVRFWHPRPLLYGVSSKLLNSIKTSILNASGTVCSSLTLTSMTRRIHVEKLMPHLNYLINLITTVSFYVF